jgi:hypothetical protein
MIGRAGGTLRLPTRYLRSPKYPSPCPGLQNPASASPRCRRGFCSDANHVKALQCALIRSLVLPAFVLSLVCRTLARDGKSDSAADAAKRSFRFVMKTVRVDRLLTDEIVEKGRCQSRWGVFSSGR